MTTKRDSLAVLKSVEERVTELEFRIGRATEKGLLPHERSVPLTDAVNVILKHLGISFKFRYSGWEKVEDE